MLAKDILHDPSLGNQRKMTVSFAGCGFLGIYHVGVASCLKEYAPHLFAGKIAGASAGSLVACGLITGCQLGECTSYTLRIAGQARSRALGPLHPSFNIVKILRDGLDEFFPENAHEIATGRLHVSLTRVSDRQNVIVNTFETREDLIQVLVCSSFVPFYCGMIPPKYKGVRYVDGGLSDNIPLLDENTITVSPFAGESDICPNDESANDFHVYMANTSIQFTLGNLYRFSHAFFPPHPEVLSKLCKRGFDDAVKFLQRNNRISCTRHLSIQSSITAGQPVQLDEVDELGQMKDHHKPISEDDDMDIEIDTKDEWHCQDEGCEECRHRRHVALLDSLPPGVLNALQAACDSVNSGILAPVYNLRAYKVISLMAAPFVLPLDVTLLLAKRIYDWAPYMPSDMQWFVQELAGIIKEAINFIQTGRHKYSARFTCQLAITESDYDQDHVISAPPTPMNRRHSLYDHYHPSKRRNLNVGFSVDFKTHYASPLDSLNELRHIMSEGAERRRSLVDEFHMEDTGVTGNFDLAEDLLNSTESSDNSEDKSEMNTCHVACDSFESCLHIANQMESILEFYYTEEGDPNVVKVNEIFALDDPRGPNRPDLGIDDLSWDGYCELKSEPSLHDEELQLLVDSFSLPRSSMTDLTNQDGAQY